MEGSREGAIDNSGFKLVISDYNNPLNRAISSKEYFERQNRNNSMNPRDQEEIIEENKIEDDDNDEPIHSRRIPARRQENEVN